MSRKSPRRVAPGALELIEEAVHLLRLSPLPVLGSYYLGSLPFVLGFLYFWADMSRSSTAREHCASFALGVALLFLWMKTWQAVFARRLKAQITDRPAPALTVSRLARVALIQIILQPSGLFLLALSLAILLPFGWVYAFYQNVTAFGAEEGAAAKQVFKKSLKQTRLWPGQNHLLLGLFLLFGLVVTLDLAVGLVTIPSLIKMLFGIGTEFARSRWSFLNTTFMATVCGLTYLCLDPLLKAAYLLRCFYGESLLTGDDLQAELRPFAPTGRSAATGLLLVLAGINGLAGAGIEAIYGPLPFAPNLRSENDASGTVHPFPEPRAKAGASSTHSKRCRAVAKRLGRREAFGVRPACRRFPEFMVPMHAPKCMEALQEPEANQPTPAPCQEGNHPTGAAPLLRGVRGGFMVRARRNRNRTECARPWAQQHRTVEGFRYDPEPLLDGSLLRPGEPHSEKSSRRAKIFTNSNPLRAPSPEDSLPVALLGQMARRQADPTPARSEPPHSALPTPHSGIPPPDLDRALEQVIQRPEFNWRLPRDKRAENESKQGIFASFMESALKTIRGWGRAVARWLKAALHWIANVIDWLREKILGKRATAREDASTGAEWMVFLQALIFVLLVLAAGAVAILFYRTWGRPGTRQETAGEVIAPLPDLSGENITASQLPEDGWLALARDLMSKGEPRLALRALYLASLAHLAQRELISVAKFKSNRDYERELRRRAGRRPDLQAAFAENVGIFDDAWYGLHEVTQEAIGRFQINLEKIRTC